LNLKRNFSKKRYKKEIHSEWWKEYDDVKSKLRDDGENWLNENYSDWKNINAYF